MKPSLEKNNIEPSKIVSPDQGGSFTMDRLRRVTDTRIARIFAAALAAGTVGNVVPQKAQAEIINPGESTTVHSTGVDQDGDNYTNTYDCDDLNKLINPGVAEICGDSIDQDCNGSDLNCSDVDNDGDGYTENEGDCADNDASRNPGVSEECDGIDNNCNNETDEGLTFDADSDGYTSKISCEGSKDDCNDANAGIHPNAEEICGDGIDQNCSGGDQPCAEEDKDGDGYTVSEDCNDSDPAINPNADEIDGNIVDENCDNDLGEPAEISDTGATQVWHNGISFENVTDMIVETTEVGGNIIISTEEGTLYFRSGRAKGNIDSSDGTGFTVGIDFGPNDPDIKEGDTTTSNLGINPIDSQIKGIQDK